MHLNPFGFITNYLVSGPVCEEIIDSNVRDNQLEYEKALRSSIVEKTTTPSNHGILLGHESRIGKPWRYHYCGANWFVDYSTFYFTLQKVRLEGATILVSERAQQVRIRLWTYCTVDIWCNGVHLLSQSPSVYKPIQYQDATLDLNQGENLLYISLQTLGTRDTRTLWGLQLLPLEQQTRKSVEGITITLPDVRHVHDAYETEKFLLGTTLHGNTLIFPSEAPDGMTIMLDTETIDHAEQPSRYIPVDISKKMQYSIDSSYSTAILARAGLERTFMVISHTLPAYNSAGTREESLGHYLKEMATISSLDRGDFGFAMPHILARKALGRPLPIDNELFLESLQQIDARFDCSDFLIVSLIRYIHNYGYPNEALELRTKEVLTGFRYWMHFEGSDAMCFWSENHSLQFYSCAYLVGKMYPDAYFSRARMSGVELGRFGEKMLRQWLDDVESNGLEEFTSACYMCMSTACLLNLIDYADEDISLQARRITDKIMETIAIHTFKGSLIAPMGRIYGDIILPYSQGAQTLINLMDPRSPKGNAHEPWLSAFATTSYRFSDELTALIDTPNHTEYTSGSACIRLVKTKEYLLTSVQSPRRDEGYQHWVNTTLEDDPDTSSHHYIKSLNERFHGTTNFNPGFFGYQQHMWTCALDCDTVVFANHPGGTFQASTMRPGYWYGNGIMPAIRQEGSILGAIYVLPESHPVSFTHVYFPQDKFDEVIISDDACWIFGRKGNGLVGLWSANPLEPFDDTLSRSELRVYNRRNAYVLIAGEESSLTDFMKLCKAHNPIFREDSDTLMLDGVEYLQFIATQDKTQYI